MKANEFENKFDEGESVLDALDLSSAKRSLLTSKRVNVSFPVWMIKLIDKEAHRVGVSRQSIIKMWLAERLEKSQTQTTASSSLN
ncbi:conserved hypothetical protein [Desulfamplus magnetovallimortis]|uniref:CopG family transcriptional regulator n=1 Tax=Desulfamplus magnetovallimortis TaxID=1246637 RepID=A0A1W1HFS1_9BACT|nr:CopG family transcriptional regulator [Desulfamplus magnetovallimortis]SLM31334.1 conserved hypothetical protein [Desulfamplus magnetovallimortis]